MVRPEVADTRPVFRIDNPEVKALFGLPVDPNPAQNDDGKHYSWSRLQPAFQKLREQARVAQGREAGSRSPFEKGVLRVNNAITLYLRLQNTVQPMMATNFGAEVAAYQASIPNGVTAFRARFKNQTYDEPALMAVLNHAQRYLEMASMEPPLIVPPHHPELARDNWMRMGEALLESSFSAGLLKHLVGEAPLPQGEVDRLVAEAGTVPLHPSIPKFAAMAAAYRSSDPAAFQSAIADYRSTLERPYVAELKKADNERLFHRLQPFYSALVLYVVAFVLACAYWTGFWQPVRSAAWWLVVIAFVVHNGGLISRMLLEGRPPVTNLYSSAIFIGWGAVGLGLLLERFWRNAIGLAVGSLLGFASLIIAHQLSLTEDTMIMMRAVLDTNFWLATHVTIVTLGYAATYVAGFIAIFYVVLGIFTPVLNDGLGRSLTRMVYGILCFATLFSFTGTVLGGIWADQSWGRFWGWDPKENGALIIVMWNALILHARLGGLVRDRGLNALAIGGNIVTSWSWFGTNMLTVGLHSYGFMDSAFFWLLGFMGAQVALIALAQVPLASWRSFRTGPPTPSVRPGSVRPRTA
jgi:ABC-type transport system involved in cytochrome c biogenesis permease subunit